MTVTWSVAFDHDHRLEPCNQSGQPGVMHNVDDLLGVLVGGRSLFSEQALAVHAHGDALRRQLIEQLPAR